LKASHARKLDISSSEQRKILRGLNEEKRQLEDKLDYNQRTQMERDKMSVDYVVFQRRLAEDKTRFRDAITEFTSASTRDNDRLRRKETIRHEGSIGAFKEKVMAEKQKSGAKATQDYMENLARIKNKGQHTMAVLAQNDRAGKLKHDLKHDLEMKKLATERAQRCNEELEKYLSVICTQYFDREETLTETKLVAGAEQQRRETEASVLQTQISEGKREAEQLRKALRTTLEMSEQFKEDIRQARQEAHDMFAGDSVAWAITAALPAIRSQPEEDDTANERLLETEVERNENDLELLLSALHLSSRREDDVTGSRGGHGSRGGFGTPRTTTFTPRTPVTPGRTPGRTPRLHTRGTAHSGTASAGAGSRRMTPRASLTPRVS